MGNKRKGVCLKDKVTAHYVCVAVGASSLAWGIRNIVDIGGVHAFSPFFSFSFRWGIPSCQYG